MQPGRSRTQDPTYAIHVFMMAPHVELLAAGRAAFAARRWSEAARLLGQAEERSPLPPEDLEALVTARFLTTPDQDGAGVMASASQLLAERGDVPRAARAAFWAGVTHKRLGQAAAGSGWLARATRLLDEAGLTDCVERGYLLIAAVFEALTTGDLETALGLAGEAATIARRFGDTGLLTFSRHLEGRAQVYHGDVQAGVAILDEAILTVTRTEIAPMMAGLLFCSAMLTVYELYDFGRAREWSAAVERWRQAQPDLAMYRGECQVHRAHVLELAGDWPGAQDQVAWACAAFLRPPPHPATGLAFYRQGELHRLTGRYPEADEAFSRAASFGHSAQPGLALLRLGEGRVSAAQAGIRRALAEAPSPLARAGVLPARVEIAVAAGDLDDARSATAELGQVADHLASAYLRGVALHAEGSVWLAAGDASSALPLLRRAAGLWQQLDTGYNFARTRLLIGEACRVLGDEESAQLEIEGARQAFERMGARTDVRRAEGLLPGGRHPRPGGLTVREAELLALLATGKTNREIGAQLSISEKTVARHVSNIFDKLGVPSRAAATAYALRHGLA
jgi:DNA-binding CsgD family transcriptional regulator